MRPRIAFALIFALGAGLHLAFLVKPPQGFGHLAFYLCWLLAGTAFAFFLWKSTHGHRPPAARAFGGRRGPSSGLWMEGLGLFVGIGAMGLVIHLLGPYRESSHGASVWTQSGAMRLMLVLCAAGCWGLLRGAPGDKTAPIPDGSSLVRAGGWLRRLAGVALGCWGAWLFVLGVQHWGQSADGLDRLLNLMFVVGGPLFFLIGLALALRRGRSGA